MDESTVEGGPLVTASSVTFRLPDNGPVLTGVRLLPALSLPNTGTEFTHTGECWTLRLNRPPVWRMEYRLRLRHRDGRVEEICDPGNDRTAPGAFGDKSVVEFPDYSPPVWLDTPATGDYADLDVPGIKACLWSPGDGPMPLLVAHDGPEYDRLAGLTRFSAWFEIPHRVALLQPGDRDDEYSGNPAYPGVLARDLLPAIRKLVPVEKPVVGMGASLGGLAMLHAQRRRPGLFGGLFLQSASFFDRRLDPQESGYSRFGRVTRFVGGIVRGTGRGTPVPVTLTCGLAEENLANNRQMAAALVALGYPTGLVEVPDAHNYVGWRDAFDPPLADLLRTVWEG
ncbi:esterase family protein [Kibdelosporangium persicum]|uniref:Enterochelin esterase n=1 Tax=Kibdelosporangium persicum TaxID=2698649 RepID=A0ABX2EUX3_9PSEU|nr:alpha/beta hydrolase-fold protein [Kibdelosporangium persicum]NRN62843.1 Enterochelin esterase [Kibdelosporangium persicum]